MDDTEEMTQEPEDELLDDEDASIDDLATALPLDADLADEDELDDIEADDDEEVDDLFGTPPGTDATDPEDDDW